MKNPAPAEAPLHDVVLHRWSPRAFGDKSVSPEVLKSLFEAARWAPSSSNTQPWAYIVGTRDDKENFDKVLSTLVEFNQGWAKHAAALALSVAQIRNKEGKPNHLAFHDVGSANAQLSFEAVADGLYVHQMAGFDGNKAREVFHIPDDWQAVTAMAIGYPGNPHSLPDKLKERELAPRSRKPLADFVMTGAWGHTASFAKK
ncbi:MAG: nitroreductase family protein [Candidatus Acidiferrum sp.]|jgi:nitroreductase